MAADLDLQDLFIYLYIKHVGDWCNLNKGLKDIRMQDQICSVHGGNIGVAGLARICAGWLT